MNGGKRSRAHRSKSYENLDENLCPNTSKRRKAESEELVVVKTKEAKVDLEQLNQLHEDTKDEVISDLGLDLLSEEVSAKSDHENIECDAKETPVYEDQPNKKVVTHKSPTMITPEHQTSDFVISRRRPIAGGLNHFSRLSDEMLLMIFHWLPKPTLCKTALVCKRWRQIAYDDTLWCRLDLGKKNIMPRNLEHVLKRGVTILRLAYATIHDPVIKPKSSYLPPQFVSKLQYLDLSTCQISVTGLYELLHTCRNLRKLSLETCNLDQKVCEAVGHNASLEALNLSGCKGLTSNGLEAILACCTSLLYLNLSWTNMNHETLETLTTTLPKSVQRLSVAGCRKNLHDEHVQAIVAACPRLVELDLSDCTIITGASVQTIVKKCESLEHLSLSRCYGITPLDFEALNDSDSLVYADIFGVLNDANLNALKRNLPGVYVNKFMFSSIARPTIGVRRTSIWGLRVRD